MKSRTSGPCILSCLIIFFTTALATVLSESVNGTKVDWFWPSDKSILPTWNAIDLANVSYNTTTTMMPELLTVCSQAGSGDLGVQSHGWVQSVGYHVVILNVWAGGNYPYTCYFDFRDYKGNQFNTPSASFFITDAPSNKPVFRGEGNQNYTLVMDETAGASSTASSSGTAPASTSASSSSTTTGPTSASVSKSSTATAPAAQKGVSPGAVASIVVAVAVAVSLIAGAIAFFCVRAARRRRSNQSEQAPLWHAPPWQGNQPNDQKAHFSNEMGNSQAPVVAPVVEKDSVPRTVEAGDGHIEELDGAGSTGS